MSYAVVTARVDVKTKRDAQKAAEELGLSLSDVVKGFLTQFIKTKSVSFGKNRGEIPGNYLIKSIKQAKKDLKTGKASPTFDNADDAIKWLNR